MTTREFRSCKQTLWSHFQLYSFTEPGANTRIPMRVVQQGEYRSIMSAFAKRENMERFFPMDDALVVERGLSQLTSEMALQRLWLEMVRARRRLLGIQEEDDLRGGALNSSGSGEEYIESLEAYEGETWSGGGLLLTSDTARQRKPGSGVDCCVNWVVFSSVLFIFMQESLQLTLDADAIAKAKELVKYGTPTPPSIPLKVSKEPSHAVPSLVEREDDAATSTAWNQNRRVIAATDDLEGTVSSFVESGSRGSSSAECSSSSPFAHLRRELDIMLGAGGVSGAGKGSVNLIPDTPIRLHNLDVGARPLRSDATAAPIVMQKLHEATASPVEATAGPQTIQNPSPLCLRLYSLSFEREDSYHDEQHHNKQRVTVSSMCEASPCIVQSTTTIEVEDDGSSDDARGSGCGSPVMSTVLVGAKTAAAMNSAPADMETAAAPSRASSPPQRKHTQHQAAELCRRRLQFAQPPPSRRITDIMRAAARSVSSAAATTAAPVLPSPRIAPIKPPPSRISESPEPTPPTGCISIPSTAAQPPQPPPAAAAAVGLWERSDVNVQSNTARQLKYQEKRLARVGQRLLKTKGRRRHTAKSSASPPLAEGVSRVLLQPSRGSSSSSRCAPYEAGESHHVDVMGMDDERCCSSLVAGRGTTAITVELISAPPAAPRVDSLCKPAGGSVVPAAQPTPVVYEEPVTAAAGLSAGVTRDGDDPVTGLLLATEEEEEEAVSIAPLLRTVTAPSVSVTPRNTSGLSSASESVVSRHSRVSLSAIDVQPASARGPRSSRCSARSDDKEDCHEATGIFTRDGKSGTPASSATTRVSSSSDTRGTVKTHASSKCSRGSGAERTPRRSRGSGVAAEVAATTTSSSSSSRRPRTPLGDTLRGDNRDSALEYSLNLFRPRCQPPPLASPRTHCGGGGGLPPCNSGRRRGECISGNGSVTTPPLSRSLLPPPPAKSSPPPRLSHRARVLSKSPVSRLRMDTPPRVPNTRCAGQVSPRTAISSISTL